ncbi:hypothetical protein A0H81_06680 [Grifola frondosa]|uniref:F-box domain-containing protein n=1 Tax=Grifola frondosa TaxID=5627 RepID=A0A1C7M7C3_GRIFR|nr:hypothetical protein A0H81_06680 [Grifola frondosa]
MWDLPLVISYDEIEELASRWPSLEVLMLNCDPMPALEEPPIDLRALIPFARHCPNLRQLGLYLSGSAANLDEYSKELTEKGPLVPFRHLDILSVGLSTISEPGPVALFLSQLCPLGCEMNAGLSWPDGFEGVVAVTDEDLALLTDIHRRASEWYTGWTEVQAVLPLLTRLRMQERGRRKALETSEVVDLRTRCRVLEERERFGVVDDGSHRQSGRKWWKRLNLRSRIRLDLLDFILVLADVFNTSLSPEVLSQLL